MCIAAHLQADDDSPAELLFNGSCWIAGVGQQNFPQLEIQAVFHSLRLQQLISKDRDINNHKVTITAKLMTVHYWLPSAYKRQHVSVAHWLVEVLV